MSDSDFCKIGNGKNKLFISYPISVTQSLEKVINESNCTIYYMTSESFYLFCKIFPKKWTMAGRITPFSCLNNMLNNQEYQKVISQVLSFLKKQKILYVVLITTNYHPDIIMQMKQMGIQVITKLVDDPEASKYYSKPAVRYYDKVICSGVYYNKKRTIQEMFYKWGAKKVIFLPVFSDTSHYDQDSIDYEKKDIDIVYIGALNWKKWIKLHILYAHFRDKVKIYGHVDPRGSKGILGLIYRLLNLVLPLPEISQLSHSEVKSIYKRTKIGFNVHLSYGPSNARSYELCLNGCLQVTDNPNGYKKLYKVGEEIICYTTMREAIKLIEYYLQHDKERVRIAKAGYKRAMKDYTYEKIFKEYLDFILDK